MGRVPDVPRGTAIRRFVVLDRIGQGSTGVVYAAFDYQLDRKIAIKLVHDDNVLAEAQALARLSHRNVVAVHDVGTFGDRVFIAMEYVDGGTLRDWLNQGRRLPEIVAAAIGAGRGLAAAHAAGIVHGDFKPENVLVDRTGRCVVVDFGLAGPISGERRGGSPAYMAAEVHDGPPTPASDQFSFCVTLYEALYGERPFAGDDPAELARAVAAGEIREAPAASRVPARLRAAIVRGLAVAPEARWPSVSALCDALAPSHRRRNAIVLAAAVLAAAGLGIGATRMLADRGPDCTGGEDRVARVSSLARSVGLSSPAMQKLDDYTRAWSAMHLEVCRATRVDGTQSAAVHDLRMECLRRRLVGLDAALAVNEHALAALSPIAECADATKLLAQMAPPADLVERLQIQSLTDEHERASALAAGGRPRDGLVAAQRVAGAAAKLRYRPLEAEALALAGRLLLELGELDEADRTLVRAIAAGVAGGMRETTARCWLDRVRIAGTRAETAQRAILARGAIEAAGNPRALVDELDRALARK